MLRCAAAREAARARGRGEASRGGGGEQEGSGLSLSLDAPLRLLASRLLHGDRALVLGSALDDVRDALLSRSTAEGDTALGGPLPARSLLYTARCFLFHPLEAHTLLSHTDWSRAAYSAHRPALRALPRAPSSPTALCAFFRLATARADAPCNTATFSVEQSMAAARTGRPRCSATVARPSRAPAPARALPQLAGPHASKLRVRSATSDCSSLCWACACHR